MRLPSIFAFLVCAFVCGAEGQMYDNLYKSLVREDTPPTIPVIDKQHAVNVSLGFSLLEVIHLDPATLHLDVSAWLDLEWTDARFSWTTNIFDIEQIKFPLKLMWTPDITLYNSLGSEISKDGLGVLENNGHTFTALQARLKTSCARAGVEGDEATQGRVVCTLKFGSWVHDGFELNLKNRSSTPDLSNFKLNPFWELEEATVERNVIYYPCCVEPYPDVVFKFTLRQRD